MVSPELPTPDFPPTIACVIRCRFIFSGKNDELTPDFPGQE